MIKSRYLVFLIFFVVVTLITIMSCGRKGTLNPNNAPTIEISEYSGISRPDTIDTDSLMFSEIETLFAGDMDYLYANLFYQEIFWNAFDNDGWIEGYAYRIGTWDSTATEWYYDRAYGIVADIDGWVYHRTPGVSDTIPLSEPGSHRTIWTSPNVVSAKVYFPSTDTTDFKNNFGKFEVKCKDDRGDISNTAAKYFCTWSSIPSNTFISTSQGNIDSCSVGTAISFNFFVQDNDPYGYGDEAAYYKYRCVNVERIGAREDTLGKGYPNSNYEFSAGTEILDSTLWDSTKFLETTNEVFLNLPANDFYELTQIQVKAVDKAGIEDPNYATMTFFVRDYFTPETRPFMSSWDLAENQILDILPHIYILGEHTYLTYLAHNEEIPSQISNGEFHYANQFYMDKNGEYSAIWSEDIGIYLKWEYYGEYEYGGPGEGKKIVGNTYFYDEGLDDYRQYYCDVEYMEIQLDGGADGLPPVGEVITDSISGENWMRIPIYEDQNCKLFDIESGEHTFKVRAVDYQGAVDPTPESLVFTLHERIEAAEKSGILVIDETKEDPIRIFCPEDSVDMFYENLLEDYTEVDIFDLEDLTEIETKNSELRNDELAPSFAPSDIQKYKLVLWHDNSPHYPYTRKFKNHYDLLKFYLDSGGNFLYTGCNNVYDSPSTPTKFLENYGGFSENNSNLNRVINWTGTLNTTNSIFVGAEGIGNYSDLVLDLNLNLCKWSEFSAAAPDTVYFPEYFPFNKFLGAIGGITYFDLDNGEEIFNFILPDSSSVENPGNYDGCIGSKYKKDASTGTTYILGFPLYYIELGDAENFIEKVFEEVGINYE